MARRPAFLPTAAEVTRRPASDRYRFVRAVREAEEEASARSARWRHVSMGAIVFAIFLAYVRGQLDGMIWCM